MLVRYVDLACAPCGASWRRLISKTDPVHLADICCPVCHRIGGAHILATGELEFSRPPNKALAQEIERPMLPPGGVA